MIQPLIKSYVRREGRAQRHQATMWSTYWPIYGVEPNKLQQTIDLQGLFAKPQSLHLEIGFGLGDNLLHQARLHPEINYIGIEVYRTGVLRLMKNAAVAKVSNLKLFSHDAVELLQGHFKDQQFSKIDIFFPDPWHKKKHHKRRLMQVGFLDLLSKKLMPGGILHFASDWEPYADEVRVLLNSHLAFANLVPNGQFYPDRFGRISTKFEERGLKLNHQIRELCFRLKI